MISALPSFFVSTKITPENPCHPEMRWGPVCGEEDMLAGASKAGKYAFCFLPDLLLSKKGKTNQEDL